jgi:hemolysin III
VRYAKPRWRGWTHLIFFELSLVLGTLLVVTASGWAETTAASIYAGSVSGLFGASALYHRGQWSTGTARRLQRLDQLMIVVLIGGTATPPILLCLPSPFDITVTAVMWTLTVAIAAFRVVCLSAAERLVGGMFIALGWTAGAALPWVWMRAGIAPAVLLVIGGAFYTAGALCYHRRRPDPVPAVFGYHEVFHALVCAAAACQYIAIAVFLL